MLILDEKFKTEDYFHSFYEEKNVNISISTGYKDDTCLSAMYDTCSSFVWGKDFFSV